MKQQTVLRRSLSEGVNFDLVEREIRKRRFGVLSTVSQDGRSHSVGVLYGISTRDQPFVLYVTTDRRSKKARNITRNENVSFAIPLQRRILRFLPPNCVQFQAIAELIASDDEDANSAFSRSLVLRETLKLETSQRRAVFIRITPDPVVFTYGLGLSIIDLIRNIGGAAQRVRIPPSRLQRRST